jgi:hypothetical protein
MADGSETEVTTTVINDGGIDWYNPKNLVNGVQRFFGGTPDGDVNVQGEVFYTTLLGYIIGNSIGTANTKKAAKRLNVGPVYVW